MDYILSLSYGKDSIACLGAIDRLGLPLTRIITVDVWATDDIPADLPPMVEFKSKVDMIVKERYGIDVEHFFALKNGVKVTYENVFYHVPKRRSNNSRMAQGSICGFPVVGIPWCNSSLKMSVISKVNAQFDSNSIYYLGIAADEVERVARHANNPNKMMPLVQIGWSEADCRKWCETNDLLSPIYSLVSRGGCWFCHNQSVDSLRLLRHNYPDLWQLLLKWDLDSPTKFRFEHTLHDFDERFDAEDRGVLNSCKHFNWDMLNFECLQYTLFDKYSR